MKWADPEYIDVCLPETAAGGRRTKPFQSLSKPNPLKDGDAKLPVLTQGVFADPTFIFF
jgi:hypothetical protein